MKIIPKRIIFHFSIILLPGFEHGVYKLVVNQSLLNKCNVIKIKNDMLILCYIKLRRFF